MKQIPLSPIEYTLTILNGIEKGTVYKLMAREITIGRGSENNICIPYDLRSSRVHARIIFTSKGVKISSMSDKNYIRIHGKNKKAAYLQNDSEFILGQTKFHFAYQSNVPGESTTKILNQSHQLTQPFPVAQKHHFPQNGIPLSEAQNAKDGSGSHSTRKRSSKRKNDKLRFYLIVAAIGLVFYMLLFSNSPLKKKKKVELVNPSQVETKIKENEDLEKAIREERKTNLSKKYQFSQAHYLKGFRDYRLGLYDRAMDSFQACLSIYSEHPLCNRYLKLTRKKQGELVQYHMTLGRRYLEQNQYQSCKNAFLNVTFLVKDKSSPIFKEAQSNLKICSARLEGRY